MVNNHECLSINKEEFISKVNTQLDVNDGPLSHYKKNAGVIFQKKIGITLKVLDTYLDGVYSTEPPFDGKVWHLYLQYLLIFYKDIKYRAAKKSQRTSDANIFLQTALLPKKSCYK